MRNNEWEMANHFFNYRSFKLLAPFIKALSNFTGSSFASVNSVNSPNVSHTLSFYIRYLTERQPSSYTAQFGNSDCTEAPHLSPTDILFQIKSHCSCSSKVQDKLKALICGISTFLIWRLNFSVSSFIRFWGTVPTYKLQKEKDTLAPFACFHVVKVLF